MILRLKFVLREKVIQRKLETFLLNLNKVILSITLLNREYSVNIPK